MFFRRNLNALMRGVIDGQALGHPPIEIGVEDRPYRTDFVGRLGAAQRMENNVLTESWQPSR